MDFWNEFSKTISNAADQTVKGTERLTSIAKLKYRTGLLKNRLDECYQNIGRLRFAEFCGEAVTEEELEGLLAEAASLCEQMKECEEKLFALQDYSICPQCGNRAKKGMSFCPKCGECLSPVKNTETK